MPDAMNFDLPSVQIAVAVVAGLFAAVTYRWPTVAGAVAVFALGAFATICVLAGLGYLSTSVDSLLGQLQALIGTGNMEAAMAGWAVTSAGLLIARPQRPPSFYD